MGLLSVEFKPVALSAGNFAEAIGLLAKVTREHIHAEFATLFDISKLVMPSVFTLPRILSIVKENVIHLESWRDYQKAFAVVQGSSSVFNAVVGTFASLSRAKNKPIFAKQQSEALRLLAQAP